MAEFTMPALGADMTEGTLVEWLVQPGDQVRKGDIVAVVDTAKAAIEVECFDSGTVERLLVGPDTTVPVGTALAVIAPAGTPSGEPPLGEPSLGEPPPAPGQPATTSRIPAPVMTPLVRHLAEERGLDPAAVRGSGPGGRVTRADVMAASPPAGPAGPAESGAARHPDTRAIDTRAPERAPAPPPRSPAASEARRGASTPPRRPGARVRATPLARRLAAEAGIDLAAVEGTGAGGAVRAADVRAQPSTPPLSSPQPAREPSQPPGRPEAMRKAIGDLMARSKRDIPHYYLSTTIDLAAATGWLHEQNRRLPVPDRLVPAALLLKAAARAAREVPQLNGFFTEGRFVPAPEVHLGVAVSLRGGGLVAPAIHRAADLPLPELMAGLRDVVQRARAGRLRGSETTDPTITVTSLGDQGVEAVFGVIYPPQVALVGLGKVVERPWAVDGLLGVRPVVTATLSADHRASDGATGARFLAALDRLLQTPEDL